ncbi:MAG TPA: HEAT repeat domain-containing protein, partial [Polyangiaceae bacterium]
MALGVAGFLALHPLSGHEASAPGSANASHRPAHSGGGGLFAWLGSASSTSSAATPAHTGTHLQQLRDARNPSEQCEALRTLALEATGDEEATDAIGDLTTPGGSRTTRLCAVTALEKVRSGASNSYLGDLLADEDKYVKSAALHALASRAADDADARGAVIAAAHSEDHETRLEALIALGDAHLPEASSLLQDAIATETGDRRERLIAALGETHDAAAVSTISAMLVDGSSQTRSVALEALGSIGGDAAVKVLEEKLKSGSREDAVAAAHALAKTGDAGAKQALLDATSSAQPAERAAAMQALVQLDGDDVKQTMHAGLSSTDPRVVT